MSAADVRAAIAAALDGMSGLRCNADGLMRDKVEPPEAMVDWEVPNYHGTFGPSGMRELQFSVMIFDQRTEARSTQKRFDTWRDPDSTSGVRYVLENDAGIAAVCDYLTVRSAGPAQAVTIGQVDYLMIEFTCEAVL